jgi:hypothetical protein
VQYLVINQRSLHINNGPGSFENGFRVGLRRGTSSSTKNRNSEEVSRQVKRQINSIRQQQLTLRLFIEIKQLFGHDPSFKWKCAVLVLIQVISLYYLQEKSIPFLFCAAYCFGGVINHSLSLAVHEISHNLSFGHGR